MPVQGEAAGEKIAKAIQLMNEKKLADVLDVYKRQRIHCRNRAYR